MPQICSQTVSLNTIVYSEQAFRRFSDMHIDLTFDRAICCHGNKFRGLGKVWTFFQVLTKPNCMLFMNLTESEQAEDHTLFQGSINCQLSIL
jgi:hypothetical protein